MKYVLLFVLTLSAVCEAHEIDMKTQYCFAYIKQMKRLYVAIKENGIQETMTLHSPTDEGVSYERAMTIAKDIQQALDSGRDPQEWIEEKWNNCMKDPEKHLSF